MTPRKKSKAESITEEYIDSAVKVHVKASDVPPRESLNISFADADKLGDEVTLSNQEAYEESHGKIYEMTHNNTVPWRNWAFYLILLSMLTVCFTFAKYASFASGDAQAAVAKFDVVVTGSISANDIDVTVGDASITSVDDLGDSNTIKVKFDENDTGSQTITFTVTNHSDVTVRIANATWTPIGSGDHHTVGSPVYNSSANISPEDSGTVALTIEKYTIKTLDNDSGTLAITVEQVD